MNPFAEERVVLPGRGGHPDLTAARQKGEEMHRVHKGRARFRIALRLGLAVSAALLLGAVLAPAANAANIQVEYIAHSPMTLPQGEMWMADIMFTNMGGQTVTIMPESLIQPVDESEPAVVFDMPMHMTMKLRPGETKTHMLMPTPSTWFEQLGDYKIWTLVDGVMTGPTLVITTTAPLVNVPKFANVTAYSGITASIPGLYECVGEQAQGAAAGDIDYDGDLDIYLPNIGTSTLWINNGMGQFTEMAAAYGVRNSGSEGHGASFADYDNDGDPDLYVTNANGANRLYRNDVSTSSMFTDVTAAAGVGGGNRTSTSSSWADFDNDGWLDVYVTNYATTPTTNPCEPEGEYDYLYHNNGDGTFTDVTYVLEGDPSNPNDGNTKGFGFQAAWFDMDGDNDQDLYLGNDFTMTSFGPDHNRLWRNNGNGTFTEIGDLSDAGITMNSMGIGVTDFDFDSDLDLAISNMMGNAFLRNDGAGMFTNIATEVGINRMMYSMDVMMPSFWGIGPNDFNSDGSEDLYAGSGPTAMAGDFALNPSAVYVNDNMGHMYYDLSAPSHGDIVGTTRGVILGDYDRDGRVDVFVVQQNGSPVMLRNVTPRMGTHYLFVDTVGTGSNMDGCGARLAFTIGTKTRYREVFCGSNGLGSSNDPTVHVGTGMASKVNKLVIKWPSGKTQVRYNISVDQTIRVTEPA